MHSITFVCSVLLGFDMWLLLTLRVTRAGFPWVPLHGWLRRSSSSSHVVQNASSRFPNIAPCAPADAGADGLIIPSPPTDQGWRLARKLVRVPRTKDWIVLSEGNGFSETQEGARQGNFTNVLNPK